MNDQLKPNSFPLAHLITVRTYGTWLHGDKRLSVDRHGFNVFGQPRRLASAELKRVMIANMTNYALRLNDERRALVKQAIEEVCHHRDYELWAVNVLINHFHVVVSARSKPEPIADAFKSYATRKLREARLIRLDVKPWARGRSRRYLWKAKHLSRAINYVLYDQEELPDFDD